MTRSTLAFGVAALSAAVAPAHGFSYSLTPVTNTTSTYAGTILIQGSITVGAGETFLSPTVQSGVALPFLSTYAAGFNGSGQTWDPGFLAWNGLGTYTGAIYNHQISANNLGYSAGMPVGYYGSNLLGPGGMPGIILYYIDTDGLMQASSQNYAINVVPEPGALALLALGGLATTRRRRG